MCNGRRNNGVKMQYIRLHSVVLHLVQFLVFLV
jgi:hypothetical protein